MAEGVFQSLTRPEKQSPHPLIANIDSCGTGAYHTGDTPDSRTMATLRSKGIKSYTHYARKFRTQDFKDFDYILAMDDDNLEDLQYLYNKEVKKNGGKEGIGRVMLFGEFGGKRRTGGARKKEKGLNGRVGRGEEIDDPYYGGDEGFSMAYEQAVRFSKAFLEELERGELS